ncbi:hypothetical protein GPSY_2779 [Paraglaciecola psychrophila 170]|nr:hypothetical protein GPSY_2779 [Paraglaciecola psychrophila 170]
MCSFCGLTLRDHINTNLKAARSGIVNERPQMAVSSQHKPDLMQVSKINS